MNLGTLFCMNMSSFVEKDESKDAVIKKFPKPIKWKGIPNLGTRIR